MPKHNAQLAYKVTDSSGRGFDTTTSTKCSANTTNQSGKPIAVSNLDLGGIWGMVGSGDSQVVCCGRDKKG